MGVRSFMSRGITDFHFTWLLSKIKTTTMKIVDQVSLPSTAETKQQVSELTFIGEGTTLGESEVDITDKVVIALRLVLMLCILSNGTEVDFNGSKHLMSKKDDIIGITKA
ncbi:hypothetical protein GIB67_011080 [Kingdonia uniflora]|uniref:Uncharacterized protein n=1 Tax=Kingdonia uniflora TaxID=39325 RepID=A0A7J7L6N4_9MAGN|nr:hypothetical protein GIB67_011080 [Kingdonia uniflora]